MKRRLMLCLAAILVMMMGTVAQGQTSPNYFPSSGNVGIGTATPQWNLVVTSPSWASADIQSQAANAVGAQLFVGTGSHTYSIGTRADTFRGTINAFNFVDETNNATRLLIDTSGNIGIGTTVPSVPLEVSTTTAGNPSVLKILRTGGNSANEGPALELDDFVNSDPQGRIYTKLQYIDQNNSDGSLILGSHSNNNFNDEMTLEAGSVGIGTTSPGARLEVNGNLKLSSGSGASITFADGTVQSTAYTGVSCGGDFAESVDVAGKRQKYEPGDVLVIDQKAPGKVLQSVNSYSSSVAGIYSTKPGYVGRRLTGPKGPGEIPMAMIGIVPTKVSAENGPIHPGDLLVTASLRGHAMKGTNRSRMLGAVLGKAMGSLESGTGVIEVLVTLQ